MEIREWEKISRLLESALSLPEDERQVYLVEITRAEGEAISNEVRALLQADQDSDGFLRTNALGLIAEQLADSAKSAEQIQPNAKYGNYRILARLGEGGMGEVYLALDETLGRKAALKFLPPLFMQDDAQLARFEREARAASALNHPNILTVYEIGSAHGRAFIATEYVEGKTLRDKIAEQNLSPKEILRIAEQIGAALNAAHASGLIHRDIKPENIMLRPDGYVKLLDFGLAKPLRLKEPASPVSTFANTQSQMRQQTQHGLILGTPRYMSPEQARGAQLDGRSDLWSLGATLYEMLTGNALFTDAATGQIVREGAGRAMIELKLNDGQKLFQPMLEKALAEDLDQRFQSAGDFLAEVKRVRFAMERSQPSDSPRRAKRWALAAAALAVAALIVLAPWRKASLVEPTADTQSSFSRAQVPTEKLYWELSETEKMAFIQDAAHDIAKMLGEDPAAPAPEQIVWIKKHVEAYVAKRNSLSIERGEESIKSVYARASVYAPFIIEAFRARSLPPILGLYIAMNETDYHPCMKTAVGAKGLFSFMPQTAVRYGLQLAPEDERCDPHKIAQAAAHYLQDLTRLFGQDADAMTLSMLAYNSGETRIASAIAELKTMNLQPFSYWTLLENNARLSVPLNRESQNYAPRFFAAAILGENPQRFGLEIQRLSAYTTTR
ncbi:MAG TPA: serine/threonine-protein kinase [Blastocatellia bacterium]|nr:serine/threonine-protein kinase [Blastocatellia bacterium]